MMNRLMHCAWAGVLVAGLLSACSSAQSRKASFIAHGKAYFSSADYGKARLEFSNALQIDPNDAEAQLMLGRVAEKLGDARGALGRYQAAINADPKQSAARAALARLFLYGGLPKEVLDLVEQGLATDPSNAELLTARGAARAQLGDTAGALADADAAQRLTPNDLYVIGLLASLYKEQAAYDKAIAIVQSGLTHYPANADLHVTLAELDLESQEPAKAQVELRHVVELEPDNLAHRYRLASFYLQQKDIGQAEQTLRDAVQRQPGSVDAKLQMVEFMAAQRGIDSAAAQVDQYLSAVPRDDALKLTLGEFLAQNARPDAAERAFRAVIARAGADADGLAARNRLASLLIARNDIAGASALIAEVLKENVSDNDALVLRSNIALSQGENQAAITDLRAVLRDQPNAVVLMRTLAHAYQKNDEPDLAEQTLRAAMRISPKDFQNRLDLAQTLIGGGKLDEAGPLLERLAVDDPGSIPVKESWFRLRLAQKDYPRALSIAESIQLAMPTQEVGYYLAGLTEELQQRFDKAGRDYEGALQRQPDSGESLAALVRIDISRKQGAAAMARVDAAIARFPDAAVARLLKGELLAKQGQTDAAIGAYQEAVRVAPNWDRGYQGLALAQTTAKRYDDAARTLQSGIDRTRGSTLLVGDLGRLYERLGRSADAIALYDSLLSNNPDSSFAANNLAMLLVTYREDPASLARAQALARQLSSCSEVSVIDTRGWVKFKSGDLRGAESLLRQAVDKQPTQPELRYHLGMAQLRSGERQPALKNLETALSSEQPFVGRDEARAALARLKSQAPVS